MFIFIIMKHMYKLFLLLILCAFGACSRPNPDFIKLENAIMQPNVTVIGVGLYDTVFIQIPATDDIVTMVRGHKNTVFWSNLESDDIVEYADAETCLIDAKTDYIGNCPYRVYCGGGTELLIAMSVNAPYATEICK